MEILQGAHGIPDVALYKNNTDGKGASYGTHENFLLDRDIPFDQVTRTMIPFLASRQRSEEHTSELQSRGHLVCRLLREKKKDAGWPECRFQCVGSYVQVWDERTCVQVLVS